MKPILQKAGTAITAAQDAGASSTGRTSPLGSSIHADSMAVCSFWIEIFIKQNLAGLVKDQIISL